MVNLLGRIVIFNVIFVSVGLSYIVRDSPVLKSRPHWLKACRRKDPEFNQCLTDMFLSMFPYLAVGIPEIKIDPFEPLFLDTVSISKGSGAISLSGSLYDMNVRGPSNSTPMDTDFSLDKKHWNFDLRLPLLDIKSKYNLKGHILVLPLVGNGDCDLKLYDIKTKVATNITLVKKEDRDVIWVESMKVRFDVGNMKIKLDNLFNGNKILGHTVNAFINKNGLEIVRELEDSVGSSLAVIFKELMNNIFTKIPLDLWYLSDEEYEVYLKSKPYRDENKEVQNEEKKS